MNDRNEQANALVSLLAGLLLVAALGVAMGIILRDSVAVIPQQHQQKIACAMAIAQVIRQANEEADRMDRDNSASEKVKGLCGKRVLETLQLLEDIARGQGRVDEIQNAREFWATQESDSQQEGHCPPLWPKTRDAYWRADRACVLALPGFVWPVALGVWGGGALLVLVLFLVFRRKSTR